MAVATQTSCSTPQAVLGRTAPRQTLLCQADAELSLAHADMIQEKRVQSIQCTGQRACADKCCPCGCGAGAARAAARAGAMRSTLVGHSRAQAWPSWPRSNKATAEEAPVGVGVPGASP